ncbi:MAG: hypothetical protein WCY11_08420 [Novosphingobium sp.]
MQLNRAQLLYAYRQMKTIREFEERLHAGISIAFPGKGGCSQRVRFGARFRQSLRVLIAAPERLTA